MQCRPSHVMRSAWLWGCLTLLHVADGFTINVSPTATPPNRGVENSYAIKMTVAQDGGQGGSSYLTWLSSKVEKSRRPQVVKFRRPRLTRDFAVLLMRSSYQVCRSSMEQRL